MKQAIIMLMLLLYGVVISAQQSHYEEIDRRAADVNEQVIQWRHHFHQYPELSNREFNTAKKIAEHLRAMGLKVDTGIAITGVVGVLDTGKPGPTIGLRADIDGLPVTERAPLPWASKERTTYLGKDVGIMHACGHDTHISMLLGAAKVLTDMKDQLKGKIVFVFQPAEEGAPPGEEGGAELMIKEGLITKYSIDVMFGQHISSGTPIGHINYKFGGTLAAADRFVIKVKGKQTHGSRPWSGVDPITAAAQIIQGLNNIVARQSDLTNEAAVISIGKIEGGTRNNIIPEEVTMIGTIRTLDTDMQDLIHKKIVKTAEAIAESSGAKAEVDIQRGYPVTFNNIELTRKMIGTLEAVTGEEQLKVIPASTGAEDFAFYAMEVPSFFYFVGGKSPEAKPEDVYPHHTPDFQIDDRAMITGVKALSYLTMDYMKKN